MPPVREAWTGAKSSLTGPRPFGSPAYAHTHKEKQKELELRAKKCILLGYALGEKEYTRCQIKFCRNSIPTEIRVAEFFISNAEP